MSIRIQRILLLTLFALWAAISSKVAAQVQVEAKLDSLVILIGQQAHMRVDVTTDEGAKVVFPHFKNNQYITPGVEVLEASETDSTRIDGRVRRSKTYTLTSFDERPYAIPGVQVKVNGRPYTSNKLALKVITVDVDTVHPEKFFPAKDVQDNPFLWSEWEPLFWMSLLVFLLALACFYLVMRLKQNKPIVTRIRIVKKTPPHQKALQTIDKLRREHLVSSEDQKAYYTQLTDALRQYIRERFGFNAMEMTSSEILAKLQEIGDRKMLDELHSLFMTADLVKFAKYSTLLNENDLNLVNAVNFIDQTKLEGQPTEERIVPKLSNEDIKTRNNRKAIKLLIAIVAVAMVVTVCAVLYQVYLLLE